MQKCKKVKKFSKFFKKSEKCIFCNIIPVRGARIWNFYHPNSLIGTRALSWSSIQSVRALRFPGCPTTNPSSQRGSYLELPSSKKPHGTPSPFMKLDPVSGGGLASQRGSYLELPGPRSPLM